MSNQKSYSIKINGINESVQGVTSLGDALSGLSSKHSGNTKGLDELAKVTKKLTEYDVEYQRALQSTKATLADKNKELKQSLDYEGALVTVEKNVTATYRDKQNLLSALGTVIRGMNAETDQQKQKQQELITQYNELNQQLKDFDATMGNHQRNVGDYRGALKEAKDELKNLKAQMMQYEQGSDAFNKLAKQAGELEDKIGDINAAVKLAASDTATLDGVISIAQSATGAFQLWTGAMNLFGVESENAEKAIQKMMSAMSIIQGLQQLQETLKSNSAAAQLLTKSMKMLGIGMDGVSKTSKVLRIGLASIGIGLIISLIATLITHWEDIVGWFQKTIPWCNNLSQKFKALGSAIVNWLTNPIKTLASIMKKVFAGEFGAALQEVRDGLTRQFKGTADAYKTTYQEEMTKSAEEGARKRNKAAADETEYKLKMLKAQKGNDAKYSKEGVALQKKAFEQRKAAAKGNAEEMKQIALDEANFYREMEENKTKAAKSGISARNTAYKKEQQQQQKDEQKALEYRAKANEAYFKSNTEYQIKLIEKSIEALKNDADFFKSLGDVENYTEAVKNLNNELYNLGETKFQLKIYEYFKDFRDNIDKTVDDFDLFASQFQEFFDTLTNKFGNLDDLTLEQFTFLSKEFLLFANLTEDQYKYLFHILRDYMREGMVEIKTFTEDGVEATKEGIKLIEKDIEKTTLKYELEQDKKSDAAIALQAKLKELWNQYLQHVKAIYGEDSEEYLKAQKKKQQADNSGGGGLSKRKGSGQSFFGRSDEDFMDDWGGKFGEKADKLSKNIAETANVLFQNVFDPVAEAFSALLEFEIEEAQEALDKATEMHDKAVENVENSQDRISDLNDKMRNSSGAQLEAYKQQMADEQYLLIQREQVEKKTAKEKEQREKELEKKQKQQRKLEMAQSLIEAIVNTAVAVTAALKWGPIIGPIFAAMIGAMGAVQAAVITKNMSKLADGSILGGKEHKDGGVKIPSLGVEVEKGEAVINKRSTAKYLPLLDAINADGNGGKHTILNSKHNVIRRFADGGTLDDLNFQRIDSNNRQLQSTTSVTDAIRGINFHPVVSVVDINRGQKDLATVRQMAGGN